MKVFLEVDVTRVAVSLGREQAIALGEDLLGAGAQISAEQAGDEPDRGASPPD
jgi:hypothetical protein